MKKISIAFAFVALLGVACGTEENEPSTPEPAPVETEDTGGGTMEDDDLDY